MIKKKLGITDVILRDAHQSLLATRMRIDDMLPAAEKLDRVGFWSVESWGGATFDSCIRYLGEDPWDRIRELKNAMPNTPQQMLLRGQNLLGYRHYADDVVDTFVERAAKNGVDVFRIFDAMNDVRNLDRALKAVKNTGKHAQGTISYTISPVHTLEMWLDLAKRIEDLGADSLAIKDMAGLLNPYVAYELVKGLKESLSIPIHMQCHATTGLSTSSILKAAEAGIDNVDTAISSMSMTYGHSPTETVVSIFENSDRDTGLDILLLEEIAAYFREVRKKYVKFEGSLRGVDSRILVAQVPGGMLTNMESQLKEQGAADKFDEVLQEVSKVREDLGFIPLVTPTSQIVGTQAVVNILSGERYKSITKEVQNVLKGQYGSAPAPFNEALQKKVLGDEKPITCRPADMLEAEFQTLRQDLQTRAKDEKISLRPGENEIDDVLTYALFPQVGLKFLKNRGNPSAFEPAPGSEKPEVHEATPAKPGSESSAGVESSSEVYTVHIEGKSYIVEVSDGAGNEKTAVRPANPPAADQGQAPAGPGQGKVLDAPLSGTISRIEVKQGETVKEGDILIVMEAMKMESEIRAESAGKIGHIYVKESDAVASGDPLLELM